MTEKEQKQDPEDRAENIEQKEEEIKLKKNKEDLPIEKISEIVIEEEMKTSFLNYAMSVIVSRALPDVRDGLKPVHRRILYAMSEMGMYHNKPFKKSARIVGEVLGKYHPHGDSAVYDTMVRMAQDFSLRYPLVNGQGNFGSIDGDSAAAMRYTEARLKKMAEEMIADIDKNTVNFMPNFDGSLKEPTVLPAKLPNLLINGSAGIAVGMATNIPPHNVGEIIDGIIEIIDDPEVELKELIEHIKGPDFPTGGFICGKGGILSAYKYGRGKIIVRAKIELEENKNKRKLVVKEIPYMVNKTNLITQIADLVRDKKIIGISDLRDESDREGMRIVIELKKDANSQVVENQLYKYTTMQTTFGVILLALDNNEPKVMNLKQILEKYKDHRIEVITRRTQFELDKAEKRAHILEGLIIALNNIDEAIKLIKASKSTNIAIGLLKDRFELTEAQGKAILEMKLQKLTNMEQGKIREEHTQLLNLIEEFKEILASRQKVLDIIKKELIELKEKYNDERKTQFIEGDDTLIEYEDMIKEEKMVVTATHAGYIKRTPLNIYKQQKRGGRGIIATGTKEEDFVEHLFVASTHSYILFFTDKGQVHWLKVYQIPEASRQARGKAIVNLLTNIRKGEKVTAMLKVKEFDDSHNIVMATKKGIIKKVNLKAFSRPRRGGIRGITLDDDDHLINVEMTDGKRQIILGTKKGMAIKFKEIDVRAIGRTGRGVRGIKLRKKDEVVGMEIATDKKTLLTITENGYGKQTPLKDYRLINRGGIGVINIKTNERNGDVVTIKSVYPDNDIMFISHKGIIIRTPVSGISTIGRNTQGVRIMRLAEDDIVVAAAKIINEERDPADTDVTKDTEEEQEEKELAEENPEEKEELGDVDIKDEHEEEEKKISEENKEIKE